LNARGVISVITSCFNEPLEETATKLAEVGVGALDIYWPLHDSDQQSLADYAQGEDVRSGRTLATIAPELIEAWLIKRLIQAEKLSHSRLNVVAMTTSFPAISELTDSLTKQDAVSSIVTLLKVGKLLGIRSLQIRAGRRVFTSTDPAKGPICFEPDPAAIKRLIGALADIFLEYGVRFDKEQPSVGLALEIEPGDGFILSDLTEVQSLAEMLSGNGYPEKHLPRGWVGLNLDIGHCLILRNDKRVCLTGRGGKGLCLTDENGTGLCEPKSNAIGLCPAEFKLGEKLTLPIFGAHLSDHSVHHGADLTPGFFHKQDDFLTWLKFYLQEVPKLLKHTPAEEYYSGHVSIELEAIGYIHHVARAHRVVNYILAKEQIHRRQLPVSVTTACIIFADLRKSTDSTRRLEGQEGGLMKLADFTRHLYDALIGESRLIAPDAKVDKFIGDAAMIVLEGDPETIIPKALRIAASIQRRVEEKSFAEIYRLDPDFEGVGIGIGCGRVASGFIGPTSLQAETVLGLEVIEASRLADKSEAGSIYVTSNLFKLKPTTISGKFADRETIETKSGTLERYLYTPRTQRQEKKGV